MLTVTSSGEATCCVSGGVVVGVTVIGVMTCAARFLFNARVLLLANWIDRLAALVLVFCYKKENGNVQTLIILI